MNALDTVELGVPMITITMDDYEELVADHRFLECLQSASVDNWEGYDDAIEMFQEEGED